MRRGAGAGALKLLLLLLLVLPREESPWILVWVLGLGLAGQRREMCGDVNCLGSSGMMTRLFNWT